ncbi:MAG: DUF4920 domain-containing protein [Bacteroidetes bacterium HGW-Bacteroidetes-1]|jgi:hypothetical protein|nr:MAG: DUF4920 domain-containing protein [Bacteroidetes bacterium HGW-Bacteroidetes-1]
MNTFKSIFFILLAGIVSLILSCEAPQTGSRDENHDQEMETTEVSLPSTGSFGEEITKDNSVAISEIASLISTDEAISVKVQGKILEVCQHTGCWFTYDLGNGEELMVNMKDHDYYIPKDAAGKTAWIEGDAIRELISVDMLKHYAQDAGKSQEFIDAITEDAWKYTIEAKGVIIE